jgi:hypothetical protein
MMTFRESIKASLIYRHFWPYHRERRWREEDLREDIESLKIEVQNLCFLLNWVNEWEELAEVRYGR